MGEESGWENQIKVKAETNRRAEEDHSQATVVGIPVAAPSAAAPPPANESALPIAPPAQSVMVQGRHSGSTDAFAPQQQFNGRQYAPGAADTQLLPQYNPQAAQNAPAQPNPGGYSAAQYGQQAQAASRRERREQGQQGVPFAAQNAPQAYAQNAPQAYAGAAEASAYQQGAPLQAAAMSVQHNLINAATHEQAPLAEMGLRHFLNMMGLSLKPSKYEESRRSVARRIRAPKPRLYKIAILSQKGSGGKSTVTAALGQTFSSIRSDGVIAADVDPAAPGTSGLAMRTAYHPEELSLYDMVDTRDLNEHAKVQKFLSTTDFNLNVLANGWKAEGDRKLLQEDIIDVQEIMSHYYSLLLWDCGVDLNDLAVRETLAQSDALVILVPMTFAGVAAAANTVDWLRAHGKQELLNRTVLVGNQITSNPRVSWEKVQPVLARQQLKMHFIPFDQHLDEGLSVDLNKLSKKTRLALEDLAALLADDFVIAQPAQHNQIAS